MSNQPQAGQIRQSALMLRVADAVRVLHRQPLPPMLVPELPHHPHRPGFWVGMISGTIAVAAVIGVPFAVLVIGLSDGDPLAGAITMVLAVLVVASTIGIYVGIRLGRFMDRVRTKARQQWRRDQACRAWLLNRAAIRDRWAADGYVVGPTDYHLFWLPEPSSSGAGVLPTGDGGPVSPIQVVYASCVAAADLARRGRAAEDWVVAELVLSRCTGMWPLLDADLTEQVVYNAQIALQWLGERSAPQSGHPEVTRVFQAGALDPIACPSDIRFLATLVVHHPQRDDLFDATT